MKKRILALSTVLFSSLGWGQQSSLVRIHNFYQSTRAMGMGNAYTAVADDFATMLYNPSLLVYRKNSEFQINILAAGLATKTLTLAKDIQDADSQYTDDNAKANAISNVLERYYGEPLGLRVSPLEFVWVSPHWGLSLIMGDVSIDMLIQRQAGPALDLHAIKDTSLSYAYAWALDETMSLGVLGKFMHRSEMHDQFVAMDLALDPKVVDFKNAREGTNFDIDLAFSWKPQFTKTIEEEVVAATSKSNRYEQAIHTRKQQRDIAQTQGEEKPAVPAAVTPSADANAPKDSKVDVKADAKTDTKTDVQTTTEVTAEKTPEVKEEKAAQEKADIDKIDTKTDGVQIETKKVVKERTEVYQPLTLSLVVRNVISMNYSQSTMVNKDATQTPENNPRVIDIGAGYSIYDGSASDLVIAVEAKNLMHPDTSVYKSSHIGLEYTWAPFSWFNTQFRVGMNQMYFTGGFGLIMGPLDLELATYGEEFGTDKVRRENRVYAATVGLKF